MIVNKRSLHYQIASLASDDFQARDLCHYTRAFFLKLVFVIPFFIIVGLGFGMMLLDPIISVILWLIFDTGFMPFFGEVLLIGGIALYSLVAFLLIIGMVATLYRKYQPTLHQRRLGVIRQSYKAWKEKYCPLIDVE